MNKKSTQVETELNQTTKRLDELTEMHNRAGNNLQTLQQGFIDGKTSLDELQTEQGRLTTLESSIKALEAKQSELHGAFQRASLFESRQISLKKAKETAIEAESFHIEYLEIRNDFHDSIRDYAEKLIGKISAYRGKQKEFEQISDETQLNFKELEQLGLSDESYKTVTADIISCPPMEYSAVIALAENLLAEKLGRAVQAKNTLQFNEERGANQQKIKTQIDAENNKPKPVVVTYDQQ